MPHNPDLDYWEARFASEKFRFSNEPNAFWRATNRFC
jgi:hypothetical protein